MGSMQQELLSEVDKHCRLTGRARSGVAMSILKDSKFFDRIEAGASCTIRTYEKVMIWFKENAPENKPKRAALHKTDRSVVNP